jgi:hypothetical protein
MLGENRSIFIWIIVVLENRHFIHIQRLFNVLLSLGYDILRCILTHLGVLHYIYGMEEATESTVG